MEYIELLPDSIYVVNSANCRINYNSIFVGTTCRGPEVCIFQSVLKFNLEKLIGNNIKSIKAKLKLFVEGSLQCKRNIVNIGYLTECFNKCFPLSYNEGEYLSITKCDLGKYIDIDVTDIVKDWIYQTIDNNGFSITGVENRYNTLITFGIQKNNCRPVLEIEYEIDMKKEIDFQCDKEEEYSFQNSIDEYEGLFNDTIEIDQEENLNSKVENDYKDFFENDKCVNNEYEDIFFECKPKEEHCSKGSAFFYTIGEKISDINEIIPISNEGYNSGGFLLKRNSIYIEKSGVYYINYSFEVENKKPINLSVKLNSNYIKGAHNTIGSIIIKVEKNNSKLKFLIGEGCINISEKNCIWAQITIQKLKDNI